MSDIVAVPKDSPLMVAWEKYKASEDFAGARQWMIKSVMAGDSVTIDGQFWGAFMSGFIAGSGVNGPSEGA